MDAQQRVILWLECHHKVSFTKVQLQLKPREYLAEITHSGKFDCPFCPDPPPEVVRQEKSSRELWKDAGEP